jgi:hypothetical protein
MLSFLASSAFFKYAQNEGFAFKNFKIIMRPPPLMKILKFLKANPSF